MKKYLFIVLIAICTDVKSQNWDIDLLNNINPQAPTATFWQKTSSTTYAVSLGIPAGTYLIGILQKDKSIQKKSWEMLGTLAINTAITQGLKYTINRQRPYEKYPLLIAPYKKDNDPSFPSGHTSTAFSIATSVSLQFPKWYIIAPAYAWAGSVGYSRLYLGEHYPSDVFAGALIGAGSAYISHWLNKKLFSNKK